MNSSNSALFGRTVSSTLYASLVAPNQVLYYDPQDSSPLINRQTAYEPIPIEAVHWDDFNIQSLTGAYGDTLSSNLDVQSSESFVDPMQISGLNTLKAVCECSIIPSMRQALLKGTEDIVGRLGQRMPSVEMVRDDQIEFGYRSGLSLLLRDASTSKTPARLVLSCFYHTSTWQSSFLTVKLSLWSLVMMSLHEKYRTICTPESILPLHLWWRYRNCEGREVFRHHLSMREVLQRPIGAVVEDMDLSL